MENYSFKQIYLHAFIAYCYNEGKVGPGDLISPLVKKTISTYGKKNFTAKEIHDEIKKDFSKDFLNILIERELAKLCSQKVIERNSESKTSIEYSLISDLSNIKKDYLISQDETTYFLKAFRDFLKNKDPRYQKLQLNALLKRLEQFCNENLIPILNYFGKTGNTIRSKLSGQEIDFLIEDFFVSCVIRDERLHKEFENIFNGINLLYLFESCAEEISNSDYSFKKKTFYLDTNILVRILELQSDYLNTLGKELLNLLVKNGFDIKVFRITLEELFSLLRGYKKAHSYFVKGKSVSHVYQTLKDKNIEPFQIDDIIEDIKARLESMSIYVDQSTKWNPVDYKEFEDKIELLAKIKYEKRNDNNSEFDIYNEDSQKYLYQSKHDIRAIELIRSLRGDKYADRFEDTEYFFITAESMLLRFNKTEYTQYKMSETIGDFSISFLLYFYDPKNVKGIALHSFIAANFNNKELSVSNWIRYVSDAVAKFKNGDINKDQLGYLLTRTIIDNNKFNSVELNDIINEGLYEYEEIINEFERVKEEKKITEFEIKKLKETTNIKISESQNAVIKKITENALVIQQLSDLTNDHRKLKIQVNSLKDQMKTIRKTLFIVFAFFIVLSVIVFFSNKVLGTALFIISTILEILNLIDRIYKFFIKD